MDALKFDPSSPLYNTTRTPSAAPTSTRSPALNTESSISSMGGKTKRSLFDDLFDPMGGETESSLYDDIIDLMVSKEGVRIKYHGRPLDDWEGSKGFVVTVKKQDHSGFLQGIVKHFLDQPEDYLKKAAIASCGNYPPDSEELKIATFFQSIGKKLGETGRLDEDLAEELFSKESLKEGNPRAMSVWQSIQLINLDLASDKNKEKIKAAQNVYQEREKNRARAEEVD
ncbi:MAG TPA: hypothetical protein VLG76_06635 [Rhabdochlamydiaceae bacterium]|nr:hypothetical protein [Rhabdochlamydiaceae bacterium]